jgi:hypothetical protein
MRINVGLFPGQDPSPIAETLRGMGALSVKEPTSVLPDVVIADFPEGDTESILKSIKPLPGVRYAEQDAWRTIE